jgi:hypothetical protein
VLNKLLTEKKVVFFSLNKVNEFNSAWDVAIAAGPVWLLSRKRLATTGSSYTGGGSYVCPIVTMVAGTDTGVKDSESDGLIAGEVGFKSSA